VGRAADVTVGIDIGTTSVKAAAVDATGTVVARARVPHRIEATADRLRHDANQAWRRGPRRALAALGEVRPRAVSVTGMVPSMAAVNRRGVPISDGLLYGDAEGRPADRHGMPDLVGDAPEFLRALVRTAPEAAGFWSAQTTATMRRGDMFISSSRWRATNALASCAPRLSAAASWPWWTSARPARRVGSLHGVRSPRM
jgi:xylulokinase